MHTCECRNGTKPDLAAYEQTVEGQQCRFWHAQCINATNEDAELQFNCNSVRDAQCGNGTSGASTTTSSSSESTPTVSRTSSGSSNDATNTGSAGAATSSPAAAALNVARNYGTPMLAGGMAAIFGLVL